MQNNNFPPLGHPEHHFTKYPNHPWLKDKNDIVVWIIKNTNNNWKRVLKKELIVVNDDFTVSYDENLSFQNQNIKYLPIQFKERKL